MCGEPLGSGARRAGFVRAVLLEATQRPRARDLGALLHALAIFTLLLLVNVALLVVEFHDVTTLLYANLVVLGVGLLSLTIDGPASRKLFHPGTWTWRGGLLAVCAMAAVFAIAVLLFSLLPVGDEDLLSTYRAQGKGLAYVLFDFCILPALAEEMAFRGGILSGLRRAFPRRTAVLMSAILFAALHLSPTSLLHLTAIGTILAEVRLRSGSLYPCFALHAGYNAAAVLLEWRF